MGTDSHQPPSKTLWADLSLLLTALIWGSGFVAGRYAIDSGMGTSLILMLRFGIAAAVLVLFGLRRLLPRSRSDWRHGIIAGALLFSAFYAQTLGLRFTTPSNNAFITATNVIMVPFITWGIRRHAPGLRPFFLAVTTFVGIGVLTHVPGKGMVFGIGDTYTLLCALLFAGHIAYLDVAAKETDTLRLTFLQMAAAAVLSVLVFVIFNPASTAGAADFRAGWLPVLYLGLFSTLLCFFIQTSAQKKTTSTKAAILLSTEALFGAVFSVLLALEPFTWNIVIGGGIILGSIVVSELTPHSFSGL